MAAFIFLKLCQANDTHHFCGVNKKSNCLISNVLSPWFYAVDGQWQEWSPWSDCSVTCANGTQQRKRQCSAAAHGGSECRGHWAESRECQNPECTGKENLDLNLSQTQTQI